MQPEKGDYTRLNSHSITKEKHLFSCLFLLTINGVTGRVFLAYDVACHNEKQLNLLKTKS